MCASCNMITEKEWGLSMWDRRLVLVECLVVFNCIIATVIEVVMTKYNLRCIGSSGLQAFPYQLEDDSHPSVHSLEMGVQQDRDHRILF